MTKAPVPTENKKWQHKNATKSLDYTTIEQVYLKYTHVNIKTVPILLNIWIW